MATSGEQSRIIWEGRVGRTGTQHDRIRHRVAAFGVGMDSGRAEAPGQGEQMISVVTIVDIVDLVIFRS